MTLAAVPPDPATSPAQFQLVLAAVLGTLGFYYLLPKSGGRSVLWGTFLSLAALVAGGAFVSAAFGDPTPDVVGNVLFWLFATAAVVSGAVLVTQPNPARGAIAFAFVVLSTCGLFLLLAAPFLMAATVIIYAGAIIVTFLFVLMLSHSHGPSGENDRTRDPLLGSLAGFAFAGLVLLTLYQSAHDPAAGPLPVPPLTAEERAALAQISDDLRTAEKAESAGDLERATKSTRDRLAELLGTREGEQRAKPSLQDRLRAAASDPRTAANLQRADALRDKARSAFDQAEDKLLGANPDVAGAKAAVAGLREDVATLSGGGLIPARNVGTIGLALYSEHLIAVELAGTLLLVATIGAVAIAHQRKGAVS